MARSSKKAAAADTPEPTVTSHPTLILLNPADLQVLDEATVVAAADIPDGPSWEIRCYGQTDYRMVKMVGGATVCETAWQHQDFRSCWSILAREFTLAALHWRAGITG